MIRDHDSPLCHASSSAGKMPRTAIFNDSGLWRCETPEYFEDILSDVYKVKGNDSILTLTSIIRTTLRSSDLSR